MHKSNSPFAPNEHSACEAGHQTVCCIWPTFLPARRTGDPMALGSEEPCTRSVLARARMDRVKAHEGEPSHAPRDRVCVVQSHRVCVNCKTCSLCAIMSCIAYSMLHLATRRSWHRLRTISVSFSRPSPPRTPAVRGLRQGRTVAQKLPKKMDRANHALVIY